MAAAASRAGRAASVFVGQALPEPSICELLSPFEVVVGRGSLPAEEVRAHLAGADAFLPTPRERVTREILAAAPHLKIVASCSVGTDHIDLPACREKGIVVTNTPGVLTEATADLAWALILAVTRRLYEGEALARSGAWDGWKPLQLLGTGLQGKTLGIYGLGRIGTAVARRGEAFGMRVLGMTEVDGADRFERLLAESDVLSLHAPLTTATQGRFGREELFRMKTGAVLVNTARGPIVNEAALVAALEAGHLRGAGLDVYENEPAIHPGLLGRADVVLLPHLGSATAETRLAMARLACSEIVRFFRGEAVRHPVG
ncbi:MAG: 2-hydroxyacid dehydrogenase [Acidithiobacillales bacterium]